MSKHDVTSDRAPEPVGDYPHAKRVGNLLFVSGIGPRQRGTTTIPGVDPRDIEAQCRSCFDNAKTVIADAGAHWQNVVDVLVFLTDMKEDFPTYNRVYAEYFAGPGNPNPTRTTIEIKSLPTPIAVEVKMIAAFDD
jgi:2-aminomuconate deaminase